MLVCAIETGQGNSKANASRRPSVVDQPMYQLRLLFKGHDDNGGGPQTSYETVHSMYSGESGRKRQVMSYCITTDMDSCEQTSS